MALNTELPRLLDLLNATAVLFPGPVDKLIQAVEHVHFPAAVREVLLLLQPVSAFLARVLESTTMHGVFLALLDLLRVWRFRLVGLDGPGLDASSYLDVLYLDGEAVVPVADPTVFPLARGAILTDAYYSAEQLGPWWSRVAAACLARQLQVFRGFLQSPIVVRLHCVYAPLRSTSAYLVAELAEMLRLRGAVVKLEVRLLLGTGRVDTSRSLYELFPHAGRGATSPGLQRMLHVLHLMAR